MMNPQHFRPYDLRIQPSNILYPVRVDIRHEIKPELFGERLEIDASLISPEARSSSSTVVPWSVQGASPVRSRVCRCPSQAAGGLRASRRARMSDRHRPRLPGRRFISGSHSGIVRIFFQTHEIPVAAPAAIPLYDPGNDHNDTRIPCIPKILWDFRALRAVGWPFSAAVSGPPKASTICPFCLTRASGSPSRI